MKRRSFIKSILASAVAPMWLPSAGRVWVPLRNDFSFDPAPFTDLLMEEINRMPKALYVPSAKWWVELLKRDTYPHGLGQTTQTFSN